MMKPIKDKWYENFFKGLNCEIWEKAISQEWTFKEVDFLINELDLVNNSRILDIPCGFGRHSVELAKRGYDVTGIDISETFIQSFKEKIDYEKLSIEVILGDILFIELNRNYSGAICMGNSFGYFTFEKMRAFVSKIASNLYKGSKFIINSAMLAESILPNFPQKKSFVVEGITMDITNDYNIEDSYMLSQIVYTKGKIKEEYVFKHYVYTLGEVKRLLKEFNLKIIGTYNSLEKHEYKLGDQQIFIVSEKE